jgi:hypothetical protein
MTARFKDLVLDAQDHQRLAGWWCEAIGYERDDRDPSRPPDWPVPISDPQKRGPQIWLQRVPERKLVKNGMHIDVVGDRDDLLGIGARLVRGRDNEIDWDVMADPEGNEFCVFARR